MFSASAKYKAGIFKCFLLEERFRNNKKLLFRAGLMWSEGLTVEKLWNSVEGTQVVNIFFKHFTESKPCPKENEKKCEAGGNRVISCVVDPLFPDQPECKCHLGFKTSEAGICVGMGYKFSF